MRNQGQMQFPRASNNGAIGLRGENTLTRLRSCETAALGEARAFSMQPVTGDPVGDSPLLQVISTLTSFSSLQPGLPIVWNLLKDRRHERSH